MNTTTNDDETPHAGPGREGRPSATEIAHIEDALNASLARIRRRHARRTTDAFVYLANTERSAIYENGGVWDMSRFGGTPTQFLEQFSAVLLNKPHLPDSPHGESNFIEQVIVVVPHHQVNGRTVFRVVSKTERSTVVASLAWDGENMPEQIQLKRNEWDVDGTTFGYSLTQTDWYAGLAEDTTVFGPSTGIH